MDHIKTGAEVPPTLSGNNTSPTATGVSSVDSRMPRRVGKKRTPHRQRRNSKISPQVQIEIVQSALARLGEMTGVFAVEGKCDQDSKTVACVTITISGARIVNKKFVL